VTLATSFYDSLGVLIPLVIVFGIFVVRPLARRGAPADWYLHGQRGDLAETQQRILSEVEAIRARLDHIEQVLTTVE
jgi:type II secretory pathway component PulM